MLDEFLRNELSFNRESGTYLFYGDDLEKNYNIALKFSAELFSKNIENEIELKVNIFGEEILYQQFSKYSYDFKDVSENEFNDKKINVSIFAQEWDTKIIPKLEEGRYPTSNNEIVADKSVSYTHLTLPTSDLV